MSTESASASNSNPSASSQYAYSAPSYFPLPFHLQNSDPATQQPYLPPPQIPPPVKMPPVPVSFPPAYPAAASVVSGVYSLPQYQQAQQLFQRDAQTITPEALESVKAALASSEVEHKAETKKRAIPRKAAGQSWEDSTLTEWPENKVGIFRDSNQRRCKGVNITIEIGPSCLFSKFDDCRLFCGDLGNEVNDDVLSKAFSRFPSFNMARVVRDKRTGKTRGYGFVSFASPSDLAAAVKEMNGKYVGNRPIKLRKSTWKERTDVEALERQKNHIQKKPKLPKKSILHK